jgi:FtsP/CotA-like multicopper oxidase with cupredoxin domain
MGCSFSSFSQVNDTLFVYKDTADIRGNNTSFCVFSTVDSFRLESFSMGVDVGESIEITVINRDTMEHTFTIENVVTTNNVIPANDTLTLNFSFTQPGAYLFYSDVSYGKHLGASGQFLVGYNQYDQFYWNLFEQETSLSHNLADSSETELPTNFNPQVYTINNQSYPQVLNDTNAVVLGNVGDTIIISIVNSGKMAHALHFHGYHVDVLHNSLNPFMEGLSKDTFPIEVGATCVVRLVPDQPGMYPVHDHNLFAVNTGAYPGGMITMQNISP